MRPPDMASIKRVLIIKMSAMGDILHALPVSVALGEAFPHLEISWLCEDMFASMLDGNPFLKEVLTVPKLRGKTLRNPEQRSRYLKGLGEIRKRKFDMTLDLQGLTKSAIPALASGARLRFGYHWLREAAKFVETPVPQRPESIHIVEQYLDVARFLGAEPKKVKFPFFIPESDAQAVDALLGGAGIEPGQPFVSINPAAGHPLKQWGIGNYASLMDRIGQELSLPAVLVTADAAVAAEVRATVKRPFVDLSCKTSLRQLASVLQKSAVHVCGDTGSAHITAALERPVIALIGPTDPDRACPYGQRQNVFNFRDRCSPQCNWHHCAYDRPKCLGAIEVEAVVQRVAALSKR